MKNFSYTKTPELIDKLEMVENLKKDILLFNISPTLELQLRYESMIEQARLFYFLLHGHDLGFKAVKQLISVTSHNNDPQSVLLAKFRNILNHIYSDWTASLRPITAETIINISDSLSQKQSLSTSKSLLLQQLLKYSQASNDHPILQAGLIHGMIISENIFENHSQIMGYITQLIFLFKNGFGLRAMTADSHFIIINNTQYQNIINQALSDTNMTPWLEFIINLSFTSFEQAYKKMTDVKKLPKNNIDLNERQKQIINYLSVPGARISNQMVQKNFHVSPITASRDLKKIVDLGIIIPLGKGRSTYYTIV